MHLQQVRFPASWLERGFFAFIWLLIAVLLALTLVAIWTSAPAWWPAYVAVIPAIIFVAFWQGLQKELCFPGDGPKEYASHILSRLVLAAACVIFIMQPDTPDLVRAILFASSAVFLFGAVWRGVVGMFFVCISQPSPVATVCDHVRFMWTVHPVHAMVERATREHRDLTPAERMAWEAYLAELLVSNPPRKTVSDNYRVRLLAHRSRLRSELGYSHYAMRLLRQNHAKQTPTPSGVVRTRSPS